MYKIGELSRLCKIPVKTLRYYDSEGLLVPDHIDRFTGYRYYSAAKLVDCNRIIALKELGFSLKEIRQHLNAVSDKDILSIIDLKEKELKLSLEQTELQLKRLKSIKETITRGESKMFDIVIRSSDYIRVAFIRKLFDEKKDAYAEAERMENILPKSTVGQRILIINYETGYKESNLDMAACVEIKGRLPLGYEFEERYIEISEETATLVCHKDELDEAYRAVTEYLNEKPVQIVGAFYEFYHKDETVELKVPVRRFSENEGKCEEEIKFENDEEVVGKWRMLDIVPSEEQFLYGHEKSRHKGWLDQIYFLEGGQPYWAVSGWSKGYLFSCGRKNKYKIKNVDGHKLLFLEMYDFDGDRYTGVPEIWVYEKISDKKFAKEDIGRCDFIDYPFIPDERILGKWKVRDFYASEVGSFDPEKQNMSRDVLYLLTLEFLSNGECVHITQNGTSHMKWTKGYVLYEKDSIASAYEIKVINGNEYLIFEWKTGDYQFGSDARIYWYIMERE